MARLTYKNKGDALHTNAWTTTRRYPPRTGFAQWDKHSKIEDVVARTPSPPVQREASVEIDAAPLSSDDEVQMLGEPMPVSVPTPKSQRIRNGLDQNDRDILESQKMAQQSGKLQGKTKAPKRKYGESSWGRNNRKCLIQDEPIGILEETNMQDEVEDVGDKAETRDEDAADLSEDGARMTSWMDHPKKKRKVNTTKTYASASINIHASQPTPAKATPTNAPPAFTFQPVPDLPSAFFDDPDATQSSRLSSTADILSHTSPSAHSHAGSPPTSPLYPQFTKPTLLNPRGSEEPPEFISCPLCGDAIAASSIASFLSARKLPLSTRRLRTRLQQIFCRQHRTDSAHAVWTERGYPNIDWAALATTRTDPHIEHLTQVIRGEVASVYRTDLLEAGRIEVKSSTPRKARAAKPSLSRPALQRYLKNEALDMLQYGYYGPRGAKVAAEALMARLRDDLRAATAGGKGDGLVSAVGMVAFVQAVLVPELVGRWVREDMGLGDDDGEEEVKRVLEESEEVGRLVNQDEDRVEGDGEGEGL